MVANNDVTVYRLLIQAYYCSYFAAAYTMTTCGRHAVLELRGASPLKEMAAPLIARFWRVQGTRKKAPSKVTICAAQLPNIFRLPTSQVKGLTQRRPAVQLTPVPQIRLLGDIMHVK